MGGRRPKQFLSVGGFPLLVRTLRVLGGTREIGGIVVAAPADEVERTRALLGRYRVRRIIEVVTGGRERQESVWQGLQSLPHWAEIVVVHDAVRPFITPELVRAVIREARSHGAAVCGLPVRETVKRVAEGEVKATLDREQLWLIQTPQAFRRDLLVEAYEKARRDSFWGTDDAVLVEKLGARVKAVTGLPENIKITTPEDLARARRAFSGRVRR
jgi:2-C-methyl-D-erythritol 4-phosphate cytidylyltransferase